MEPRAFIAAVEAAWRSHAETSDGRRLTRLHVHVAAKLAYWRSPNPKQRDLARAASCCARTVQRALAVLRDLGLVSWTRRYLVAAGWRAQVASRYVLSACLNMKIQRLPCSASVSPPGRRLQTAAPAGVRTDLLQARQAAMMERMRAERAARMR